MKKPAASQKRAQMGDVLEIDTPIGLAYFQYTHQHAMFGGLIRVLLGTYRERPSNFAELVRGPDQFRIFLPVRASASRGFIRIVSNEEIPPYALPFPLFKSGRPGNWWLWDGEREWRVCELTVEQRP